MTETDIDKAHRLDAKHRRIEYKKLFDKNDPQLRADVLAALKAKHFIDNSDPFYLELALQYGSRGFYDRDHKVDPETVDKLKSAVEESVRELKEEPEYSSSIVISNIIKVVWRGWDIRGAKRVKPLR